MGDDSSGSLEGKSLSNLRVVDLKLQLEKRGLSKSGSKKELVKRLKQKLELEKLYEESAAIGDTEPKLHLDEATEQNEFVKQYLAEQQKIYARQKEVKRLIELKEQNDEEETDSDFGNKDQDSDVSESISVAKNSCDSSTHAEGGEEEEMRSMSEGSESQGHITKEGEPESSTPGESLVYETRNEDHSHTESSDSRSSMESANPGTALSYSLADIQLPDSPKKVYSKVVLKTKPSDVDKPSSHEPLVQDNVISMAVEGKQDRETNGTSTVDEDSNNSRELDSSAKNIDSLEMKDQTQDADVPEEKDVDCTVSETQETSLDTLNNRTDSEVNVSVERIDDTEHIPEKENAEPEVTDTKEADAVPENNCEDNCVSSSPKEEEPMDVSELTPRKPKREDIEEGETDVDSESEEDDQYRGKDKTVTPSVDKRTVKEFSRRESRESAKSDGSESREPVVKELRSSSSDSSSSHESIPKRKPYRSSIHITESHVSSSSRQSRHSAVEESVVACVKSPTQLETPKSAPRRVKIKRSTPIVAPVEPEPKKESVKRHHKKIEIDPVVEESKSTPHHTIIKSTSVEEKPSTSKQEEFQPKKRPAAEVPADVPPAKVTYRKLNVPFRKSEETKDKVMEKDKKRLWHGYGSSLSKTAMSISSDSLKSLIPDFKVVCSSSILSDTEEKAVKSTFEAPSSPKPAKEYSRSHSMESLSKETNIEEVKKPKKEIVKELPVEPMEVEENPKRTVLPEKPRSNILFVKNLVRPFTLLQLKEVLKHTGTVVEDGFWIDKIKSKCFVTYENEEQAAKTREALNHTRWPASNPKILSVEFTTHEEFDFHKNSTEPPTRMTLSAPSSHPPDRQELNIPSLDTPRKKEREEKDRPRERERQRQAVVYIREWDKDKLSQESPEREKRHSSKRQDRRSSEKKDRKGKSDNIKETEREEKDVRKRQEEDTPAKLLDDLFQKTKATPCIYWLPLTEEQVKQKEEQRRLRRLEREKQNREREEAERQSRRKPSEKDSRSRSRSPPRRR